MRVHIFAVALLAAAIAPSAGAQEVTRTAEGTLITIVAEGAAEAAPDMATITLGVVSDATDAETATAETTRKMNALLRSLRSNGIAERDMRSAYLMLTPRYDYDEDRPPRVIGYSASNQVTVRVRNTGRVGEVLDEAVRSGADTVHGISFGIDDMEAQRDRARVDAAEQAQHRAALYARAFGMRVDRMVSMIENGAQAPAEEVIVVTGTRTRQRDFSTTSPVPVAPGEIETRVRISVTYLLR